jgi:hypothetical protein
MLVVAGLSSCQAGARQIAYSLGDFRVFASSKGFLLSNEDTEQLDMAKTAKSSRPLFISLLH